MNGFSIISFVFLFFAVLLGTGPCFYLRDIRVSAERTMKRLGLDLDAIECSFEQIIYFVTLPSHLPVMREADKDDICLRYDLEKGLFPKMRGLKVYIETEDTTRMIAYLAMEEFRIPKLDRLYVKEEVSGPMYQRIATAKMMLPFTQEEIKEEVYHQLKVGQFEVGGGT